MVDFAVPGDAPAGGGAAAGAAATGVTTRPGCEATGVTTFGVGLDMGGALSECAIGNRVEPSFTNTGYAIGTNSPELPPVSICDGVTWPSASGSGPVLAEFHP